MINQNGGKCGICGDNYADPKPRDHENGGMFANGIIVRRYAPGQVKIKYLNLGFQKLE